MVRTSDPKIVVMLRNMRPDLPEHEIMVDAYISRSWVIELSSFIYSFTRVL